MGRGLSRFWAAWASLGLPPYRQVQLEVKGRRTGRPHRLALVVARYQGQEHLVSMLGEGEWVKNVRAAGCEAFIVSGRRRKVSLQEVPVAERAPIIQEFLRRAPGGRPHLGLGANATLAECEGVASTTPVFRVVREIHSRRE
ncbi:MAG: nitroreductase family deazaflavin-dependent oxidoreductase [Chloroflexota bacterium]|nr:nitroreductase family deazaflavin-dependent oxidoreductase [Chloroflexota bacterium]MDE3101722.1 nitroreductase family deazaflavin-dependent oxidoreductase [Chloroflexota bacterium]